VPIQEAGNIVMFSSVMSKINLIKENKCLMNYNHRYVLLFQGKLLDLSTEVFTIT
jgi:hypothetical protein